MKAVYLTHNDILKAMTFARSTVAQHYRRMWRDTAVGVIKITQGKLGEMAVHRYCRLLGLEAELNLAALTEADTYDLLLSNKALEVKTKVFRGSELPKMSEIYLHIPVGQYRSSIQKGTAAWVACCLCQSKCGDLLEYDILKCGIVGALSSEEYDRAKVLHRVGQQVAAGFVLPWPDSYGVSWDRLADFDNLLAELA